MTKKELAIKKAYEAEGYKWDVVKVNVSMDNGWYSKRFDHSQQIYSFRPTLLEGVEISVQITQVQPTA